MKDVLETLYQHFYVIPQHTAQDKRIEVNYQVLAQHLNQEDLNRMMHIMDDKDLLLSEVSMDSFIRGFQLGMTLFHQVSVYKGYSCDEGVSEESSGK